MLVKPTLGLLVVLAGNCVAQLGFNRYSFDSGVVNPKCTRNEKRAAKDAFIDAILNKMTVPELGAYFLRYANCSFLTRRIVLQLHLMFADNMVGPNSDNALYGVYVRHQHFRTF